MRKIWFFFLFLFLNSSCEPDDVCSEANPSTPQLVFRLYDSSQSNELKAVDTLRIMSLGDQAPLEFINTDSIVFPLQVNANKINTDLTISNGTTDRIEIDYLSNDVYLNRACGFQSTFQIHTIEVDQPANWINSIEIVTNEVIIDTLAHVKIYH
tara:strand:+ start:2173 stop:2634 length:462 start_codon:yes stop_codon:yes gene_type:complete